MINKKVDWMDKLTSPRVLVTLFWTGLFISIFVITTICFVGKCY